MHVWIHTSCHEAADRCIGKLYEYSRFANLLVCDRTNLSIGAEENVSVRSQCFHVFEPVVIDSLCHAVIGLPHPVASSVSASCKNALSENVWLSPEGCNCQTVGAFQYRKSRVALQNTTILLPRSCDIVVENAASQFSVQRRPPVTRVEMHAGYFWAIALKRAQCFLSLCFAVPRGSSGRREIRSGVKPMFPSSFYMHE